MVPMIPILIKNWRLIAIIVGLVAIVSVVGVAYWHYTGLLSTIEELKVSNAELGLSVQIQETHITQQKEALATWAKSQEDLKKKYQELSRMAQEASKETRRLHDIFSKHDLGKLASKKPGLIQNRVNSGTVNLFRMFECETSSTGCGGDSSTRKQTGSP